MVLIGGTETYIEMQGHKMIYTLKTQKGNLNQGGLQGLTDVKVVLALSLKEIHVMSKVKSVFPRISREIEVRSCFIHQPLQSAVFIQS